MLLQCVRMVMLALLWPTCPWWSDNSWHVIFSSSIPAGIYCNFKETSVVFSLFASNRSSSLSSAALDDPMKTISLMTISSTDLALQSPSVIDFHYLPGLSKLTPSAFALDRLPSLHSSPNPSFTFFSAAHQLLSGHTNHFFVLCFIS